MLNTYSNVNITSWRTKCAKKRGGCGAWIVHDGKRQIIRCNVCDYSTDCWNSTNRTVWYEAINKPKK